MMAFGCKTREDDSNSQTPRNNTLQEETVGFDTKLRKQSSRTTKYTRTNDASPSKRSGGPRSGGKLDRLRRTYSLSLEAARKMCVEEFAWNGERKPGTLHVQGSELLDREQAKICIFAFQ